MGPHRTHLAMDNNWMPGTTDVAAVNTCTRVRQWPAHNSGETVSAMRAGKTVRSAGVRIVRRGEGHPAHEYKYSTHRYSVVQTHRFHHLIAYSAKGRREV